MMNIPKLLIILCCSLIATFGQAQFSLPSMDVKLTGGASVIPMSGADLEGGVIGGELNIHINENIAVGPFFSKGLTPMQFLAENEDYEADQWIYGIQVRLSTDRSHKIRPYLNLNYYKSEFIVDYEDFRTAGETSGYGAGLGLLIRLTNRVYLNAIDLSIKKPTDDLFLLPGADFIYQASVGASYNFGRKK